MSTPWNYVYLEPENPEGSEPSWVARLAPTRQEAEYHSPYVLTFAEFMAMENAPDLQF